MRTSILAVALALAAAGCHGSRSFGGFADRIDEGAERPSLAVSPADGSLAIVHETRDGRVRLSESAVGRTWTSGEPTALSGGFAARAAFGPSGALHVSYGRRDLGRLCRALREGGDWSTICFADASVHALSDIAIDAQGVATLAFWEDDHDLGVAGVDGVLVALETADDVEDPLELIVDDRPHLALLPSGDAAIAYAVGARAQNGVDTHKTLRIAVRNGGVWTVRDIAPLGALGRIAGLDAAAGGSGWRVAFTEEDRQGGSAFVYGSVSTAGAFAKLFDGRGDRAGEPQGHGLRFAVRPDGAAVIAYSALGGGLDASIFSGGVWTPQFLARSPGGPALTHPSLAFGPDGALQIAYGRTADDALFFVESR